MKNRILKGLKVKKHKLTKTKKQKKNYMNQNWKSVNLEGLKLKK